MRGQAVAASRNSFPAILRNKVPAMVFMFVEQRYFGFFFGVAICVVALHGPLIGRRDPNGFRYLLGPLVCPAICAVYFLLRPFNPYRGVAARLGRVLEADQPGSDEKCLVDLFKSKLARQFILRTAAKISGLLLLLMAVIAGIERNSLSWSLFSYWSVPGILCGCIGSFIALGSEYIAWGLRTWAAELGTTVERTSREDRLSAMPRVRRTD